MLLANEDALHLPHDVILREVAFYLLAGAHTSATAFTRVQHNVFTWLAGHPEDADARADATGCSCSAARTRRSGCSRRRRWRMRWALADIELQSGRRIAAGRQGRHRPARRQPRQRPCSATTPASSTRTASTPDGVPPYGLSFGSGMHACIGQDLAAGLVFRPESALEDHVFGLVPEAVQALFDHGVRPDPDDPPEMDDSTTRPYFGRYPVLFERT